MSATPVRVEAAAAADAHRHSGERGSWQREDVRIDLSRLDDSDSANAAPSREVARVADNRRVPEARDGEFGDGCGPLGGAIEPRSGTLEADQVQLPALRIEASDQLGHLTFG